MGKNIQSPFGKVYTMQEAAQMLRISRRALQDLIKVHRHYSLNGHKKLFSETDIHTLWEAMRCPSSSSIPAPAKRRSTPSVGRTSGSMWTEVQRRLKELRQSNS